MSYSNNQNNMRTRMQNSCNAPSMERGCGRQEFCIDQYPVAMAYVPWQQFGETYPFEHGFHRGTIFPELDLPFLCANPACGSAVSGMRPGNMRGNMQGNRSCSMNGNMPGNKSCNMSGNMPGNRSCSMNDNMPGNRSCSMGDNQMQRNNMSCNERGGRA